MDINAVMLRAVGALNHMADTCQYLEQKSELRQISQELISARVMLAEQIKAHKKSIAEIIRLRDAMFKVYAAAANGGNTELRIESMRDEMDKPWSVDASRASLARLGAANG